MQRYSDSVIHVLFKHRTSEHCRSPQKCIIPFDFVGITQVWYDVCILYFSGKHGHTVHAMALKF